jgi:hypothetical protein
MVLSLNCSSSLAKPHESFENAIVGIESARAERGRHSSRHWCKLNVVRDVAGGGPW